MADDALTPEVSLPPPSTPRAGTPRLREHVQFSLTLGFLALGMLVALQVNTQRAIHDGNPSLRRPDKWYQEEIRARDQRLKTLETQHAELTRKLAQFESASGQVSQQSQLLKIELEATRMLAGLTPVEGPGVVVTVSDNRKAMKIGDDSIASIVHDEDLLKVANELWNAGAEAVAINGIRLSAGWDVRCAGAIIKVRGQRVTTPCKLEAIGDPPLLQSALNLPDGIVDYLRNVMQLKVAVRPAQRLRLEAGDAERFKFARPVKQSADR